MGCSYSLDWITGLDYWTDLCTPKFDQNYSFSTLYKIEKELLGENASSCYNS